MAADAPDLEKGRVCKPSGFGHLNPFVPCASDSRQWRLPKPRYMMHIGRSSNYTTGVQD
jgi:hypothetical protein